MNGRQAQELEPGTIFEGKYRIDGVLGSGGMGIVLRATHILLGTPVAIKLLHPELTANDVLVSRFLREARNAASIDSEHVGRVLDVAMGEGGRPHLVMELLPGHDLAEVCEQRGKLGVHEAVAYVLQACEAVACAHAIGIVHRDLKPSNLFLSMRGDRSPIVKVFDFGISKTLARDDLRAEQTETLTKTGVMLGTPAYMAPEQIADTKNTDERCDVWSLGVILYELLTGRQPFEGGSLAEILTAVSSKGPEPLRNIRKDVPAELESIVLDCLKKNRDERIPSVVKLAERLGPWAPSAYRYLVARVVRAGRARRPASPEDETLDFSGEEARRLLEDTETGLQTPQPSERVAAAVAPSAPTSKVAPVAAAPSRRPGKIDVSPATNPGKLLLVAVLYTALVATVTMGIVLARTSLEHGSPSPPLSPPSAEPIKASPSSTSESATGDSAPVLSARPPDTTAGRTAASAPQTSSSGVRPVLPRASNTVPKTPLDPDFSAEP